jgi:hypothetical protein
MKTIERVTTTEPAPVSGVYRCLTCEDADMILFEGERAPMCDNCKRPVSWELRRVSKH